MENYEREYGIMGKNGIVNEMENCRNEEYVGENCEGKENCQREQNCGRYREL